MVRGEDRELRPHLRLVVPVAHWLLIVQSVSGRPTMRAQDTVGGQRPPPILGAITGVHHSTTMSMRTTPAVTTDMGKLHIRG